MTTTYDWGNIAEWAAVFATIFAVMIAYWAIRAKRADDRRAGRLTRLNQQLSQLYGKLSILNEAGMRNWNAFVSQYSNDKKELGREFMRFFPYDVRADEPITAFNPPEPDAAQLQAYCKWLRTLFMKTNEGMLEVIYGNADLVVGKTMPSVFIVFAEHVASLRLLVLKIEEEEKNRQYPESNFLDNWREYVKLMAPYPTGFGHYINASFEILKEEQERLLSVDSDPLTEKEVMNKIKRRVWEKEDYWCKKEYEIRLSVGQIYEYKPIPEPRYE